MAFTFFFRDQHTLDYSIQHLLPYVSGKSKIKIWDAGCASGQEPYTFAILLAEKMGKFSFKNVEIHATDIDISNQFGKIITTGIYAYTELQRIPEDLFAKYFTKCEDASDNYQIVYELRSKVKYKREDLLSYVPTSNDFSLIICKNVLLHQSYEQRIKILEMFHSSLSDGGLLVMEQTQKMPEQLSGKFELLAVNAQAYRKK